MYDKTHSGIGGGGLYWSTKWDASDAAQTLYFDISNSLTTNNYDRKLGLSIRYPLIKRKPRSSQTQALQKNSCYNMVYSKLQTLYLAKYLDRCTSAYKCSTLTSH